MTKADVALGLAIGSLFATFVCCIFCASIWIRMDIAERTGTERVIIVQQERE